MKAEAAASKWFPWRPPKEESGIPISDDPSSCPSSPFRQKSRACSARARVIERGRDCASALHSRPISLSSPLSLADRALLPPVPPVLRWDLSRRPLSRRPRPGQHEGERVGRSEAEVTRKIRAGADLARSGRPKASPLSPRSTLLIHNTPILRFLSGRQKRSRGEERGKPFTRFLASFFFNSSSSGTAEGGRTGAGGGGGKGRILFPQLE